MGPSRLNLFLATVVTIVAFGSSHAEEIRVLNRNVESDGNDPAVIAEQLTEMQANYGPYDLIALSEVRNSNAASYEQAAEDRHGEYDAFTSSTGGSDRMTLSVRSDRFEVLREGVRELTSSGGPDSITFPSGSACRPFLIDLRDSANSGLEFIFMVNQPTRGNAQNRQRQAEGLRERARDQAMPVITAGDFSFDFDFRNLTCNQAMAIFMRLPASNGGAFVWQWVIPASEFAVAGTSEADRRVAS